MKIGFETHIPLNTQTKLFSDEAKGRRSAYAAGEPGTRPVLQEKAVKDAIRLALTLDMDVTDTIAFDRKQYFYPDLPKGYQITQHRHPIAMRGTFSTTQGDVSIKEIHLEEDPSSTRNGAKKVYVDDTRSGEPLIELVTKPCLNTVEDALAFIDELATHVEYLGILDTTKGFKTDINLSIEATDETRVEVKNVTGTDNIKDALQYEHWRQTSAVETGHTVERETRHFDAEKTMTIPSRSKETYTEYAFIPEPDIPATRTHALVEEVEEHLPKPRQTIIEELTSEGISKQEATTIASHPEKRKYYESLRDHLSPSLSQTVITEHIPHVLDQNSKSWEDINAERLADITTLTDERSIPEKTVKDLLWNTLFEGKNPAAWLNAERTDDSLQQTVKKVVEDHPSRVEAYNDGDEQVVNAFIGDVTDAHPDEDVPTVIDTVKQVLENTGSG